MTNEKMLMEVFRQNFENMRHGESERRWFMHIYTLTIIGVLAFILQANLVYSFPFWLILFLLSLVGLLLTIRWNANINIDIEQNKHAVSIMPEEIREIVSFGQQKGWTAKISLRTNFVALYIVFSTLFLGLLIYTLVST